MAKSSSVLTKKPTLTTIKVAIPQATEDGMKALEKRLNEHGEGLTIDFDTIASEALTAAIKKGNSELDAQGNQAT